MRAVMIFMLATLTVTGFVIAGEVMTRPVVQGGQPTQDYRRMLVGPGVNQPNPFPGYGGCLRQAGPIRLRRSTRRRCFVLPRILPLGRFSNHCQHAGSHLVT